MLGEGGVGSSLFNCLSAVDRVCDVLAYSITTCALHGLNLTLSVPIESVLGPAGLGKRTALQLLFTAYNLVQSYRSSEWLKIWRSKTNDMWNEMMKPVLSRWDSVLEAVEHVLKYLSEWMDVAQTIVKLEQY